MRRALQRDMRLGPLVCIIGMAASAMAQTCQPVWRPGFHTPDLAGGSALAMAVFDDGTGGGPALFVGGNMPVAGPARAYGLVKWNGRNWIPIGRAIRPDPTPTFNETICSMTVFDPDGPGPRRPMLVVGGNFTTFDDRPIRGIAAWDGGDWEQLGQTLGGNIKALAVYRGELYAGVSATPPRLVRWDGSAWQDAGGPIEGWTISALAVHDDGSGPGLYVGGYFSSVGGLPVGSIARWDGLAWSSLHTPLYPNAPTIDALVSYHGNLYAGGDMYQPGSRGMARWDGDSWHSTDASLFSVHALSVIADLLYVGGEFFDAPDFHFGGAVWNGASLTRLPGNFHSGTSGGYVAALGAFDEGAGPRVFIAGSFTELDAGPISGIARWDGSAWSRVGPAGAGLEPYGVRAVFAPGAAGPGDVYAAGTFVAAGGSPAAGLARWDGASWHSYGSGPVLAPYSDSVSAVMLYRGQLYAGGGFGAQSSSSMVHVLARWNGTAWEYLGPAMFGHASALAVFDDQSGAGPALFVGGLLSGTPSSRLARWDGTTWSVIPGISGGSIGALAVLGGELVAGGTFTQAGGAPASGVAAWDGSRWRPLGSGVDPEVACGCWQFCQPFPLVSSLAVHDDGGGPALYAGGSFTSAGGVVVNNIARWNGSAWLPLGPGLTPRTGAANCASVNALASYRGRLVAGGWFERAGPVPLTGLGAWDGVSWSPAGEILEGPAPGGIAGLAVAGEGTAQTLYVGGIFNSADGQGANCFAALGCAAPACYANCDGSTAAPVLDINDWICFLGRYLDGDPRANCDGSAASPALNVSDFICFIERYAAGCP